MVVDIETAISRIETVTGLDFVRAPNTTDSPERDPVDAAGNAKPVIIGLGTAAQFPLLGGGVVGYAGPYYSRSWNAARFSAQLATGKVVFDVADAAQFSPGFGTGTAFGKVVLHELGHLIGLGHVNNLDEIMNPILDLDRAGAFGAGDTLGLQLLYQTQDCPASNGTFRLAARAVEVPDFGNRQGTFVEAQ